MNRDLKRLQESFSYLVADMNFRIVREETLSDFGNVSIDYDSDSSFAIRLVKDRGYFGMQMLLEGEYLEIQLVYRYLFPDRLVKRDFKGKAGLEELVAFSKAALTEIRTKGSILSRESIHRFYAEHPVSTLRWK